MKRNLILASIIIFSLLYLNLINAELQVGNQGTSGVNFQYSTPVNYTLVNTNNSIFWQGHTGTDGSWLTGINSDTLDNYHANSFCFANGTNSSGVNCQTVNGMNYNNLMLNNQSNSGNFSLFTTNGTYNDLFWNFTTTTTSIIWNLFFGGIDGTETISNTWDYTGQTIMVTNLTNVSSICNDTSCFTLSELNASSSGNSSWNQSFANTLYTNFSSFNSTQMTYSGGFINILESWLKSLFYTKSEVWNTTQSYNITQLWNKTQTYNKTEIDNNLSNYAKYSFGNNNFNGSGNITTTGYLKDKKASQFLEVSFGEGDGTQTNYTIGGFAKVDFHNLLGYSLYDPGSNYVAADDWYVVPVNGIYKITTRIRVTDNSVHDSYGLGSGLTEEDNPSFSWFFTNGWGDTLNTWTGSRNGAMNIRTSHFNQGDQIRMFGYSDTALTASDGSMTIELLYAD